MIITIFGATGMVGKKTVRYALANGYTVRAFGRNIQNLIDTDLRNNQLQAIHGYVFNEAEVYQAIHGADAVISVLGGGFDGKDKTRSLGIKNIIAQMHKAQVKRIIALGNTGILDDGKGKYIMESQDFPKEYLPVGQEHLQAYLYLKDSGLDWTFVCAPDIHDAEYTNQYSTQITYMIKDSRHQITSGDLAQFMVKEVTDQQFIHDRVAISN
ncbi:MAG: NAD(P)H-binding protein [Bacteroidetes bacterium]|nr:NAD(P)H-binding protein [Bacteroidota bacterium]